MNGTIAMLIFIVMMLCLGIISLILQIEELRERVRRLEKNKTK